MELVNKGLRQRFSMRDSATERPELVRNNEPSK